MLSWGRIVRGEHISKQNVGKDIKKGKRGARSPKYPQAMAWNEPESPWCWILPSVGMACTLGFVRVAHA